MLVQTSVPEDLRKSTRKDFQAHVHRALRNAVKVLKIKDNIAATASTMLCYIPKDAEDPISPVQVQRLADERGTVARTVHNHIKLLIQFGLAIDLTRDGGGRSLTRNSDGNIVSIHGISFQPLLDKAAEFEAKVHEINAIATEKAVLRGQISSTRRKIRRFLELYDDQNKFVGILDDSPRRIVHLTLVELNTLFNNLDDLYEIIKTELEPFEASADSAHFSSKESDQSEKNVSRYNNTTETNNSFSNRETIKPANELSGEGGKPSAQDNRSACGLDHVGLDHAMKAAPEDWTEMIKYHGTQGWAGFCNYAYERGAQLGMNRSAWALAERTIGRSGAALLVLIADVNSTERGGDIRSPAGWVRAMADKASRGEAHIHRSIFGILNKCDQLH